MKNENVSLKSLGRLFGMLLFCGLCGPAISRTSSLVGFPIHQEIARFLGLIVGWRLFPLVFKPEPSVAPSPQPEVAAESVSS